MWDVLTTGNDFACIIVFLALLYVFLYLSARRSHTTSFCRACVIVTPFTHEPTHRTVWDVHTNGNVFPGLTVWDVHKNENIFLGLTVWNVHKNGNV